ncbi:DNA-directed RNA polymerase subunit beta' [Alphaproteobacteria bacterium]|nr:DNA-directed RNA polymerase subunit beta' [Alphaproteobacteria bacterium]
MMSELMKTFGAVQAADDFNRIRISIASPEKIRSWSYGEVKKPETINYRTFKPERDGLFCAKIFGPIKDYECLCGKYKRMKFKGVVCEKCQVEVTLSKVRRERMGHIELAAPVAHIWFMKSLPSRIGLMADLMLKDLEAVLYFEKYIVVEPGLTPLKLHEMLTEEQYLTAIDEYGEDSFRVGIGAEALKEILSAIDLGADIKRMRVELIETTAEAKRAKLVKRLKLFEAFHSSGTRPEWMILDVLPVLPPELRPLVPLDGGRFATSDLNDLYRRVVNRNNRLKRLLELHAPDIIIRNEKRMLQESVDALFDNGRRGRAIAGANKRALKSITDMLKGKHGRFRENLLGKRVDYSGRSVITVEPTLRLHQCGLPKKMALELFKPFIYAKLEQYGLATTIKAAKKMVERERPEVWDILEDVIREHPVMLNRAPTLHRLGIQAFEPVMVEGKAIQLHPLVCAPFNADFDGDQMAVHVPLSLEAQLEARTLMMSTNNILFPASGKPSINPSQDMILGIYYLSLMRDGEKGEGGVYRDMAEIETALEAGALSLHAKITTRFKTADAEGKDLSVRVETTAGRMYISEILPKSHLIKFDLINKVLAKKAVGQLLDTVYKLCGQQATCHFADEIMRLGFKWAAKAGISLGKDDLIVPQMKTKMISDAGAKIQSFEKQYQDGLITQQEKKTKAVNTWTLCDTALQNELQKELSATMNKGRNLNSMFIIMESGARGSITQVKQLAGMRGLMTNATGGVIETPIVSNFKEGMTMAEYFNSCHASRKALTDTALKTARSGYLTRRLVSAAQDAIITQDDCGTTRGITVRTLVEGANVIASLSSLIAGRTLQEDVLHPETGKVLFQRGKMLGNEDADAIEKAGVDTVLIRSALTCDCKHGICSSCYGQDLARGGRINLGEAVGIIAAQSIGEPGTQLTMRTFHVGGVALTSVEQSAVEAFFDGKVVLANFKHVKTSAGHAVVTARNCMVTMLDTAGREKAKYRLPYGAKVYLADGAAVQKGQKVADWDPYTLPVIAEREGTVKFIDMIEDETFHEVVDESTGQTSIAINDWRQQSRTALLKPQLLLVDGKGEAVRLAGGHEARYFLSPDAMLSCSEGDKVKAGDVIIRLPKESDKSKDIVGGLPRVADLFEARQPKDPAIIAAHDGRIEFAKDYKTRRRIFLINDETQETREYIIPRGKQLIVSEGDSVMKGDILVDGQPVPQDILQVKGVEALAAYLINEIQAVYRLQGIQINDKHMEVIVRQMLQKLEVIDSGDTTLLVGDKVSRDELAAENAKVPEGGRQAKAEQILLGIAKTSLSTDSFISAASFQETTRVFTEASVLGREDSLVGLKENVIVGRLIPAGTGAAISRLRAVASAEDAAELARKPAAPPAAA